MPKESRILEQRIQDLESEVGELVSHPRDEHARRFRNLGEASHSIRRRINFLRTLLFAEKYETQAVKKLNHMNTRLANLESKFTNWFDSQNQGEGDGQERDTSSSCSCTHSCVNGGNGEEDYCEEVAVEQAAHHLVGEHGWFEADLGLEQYELLGKEEAAEENSAQFLCELQGKEEVAEENGTQLHCELQGKEEAREEKSSQKRIRRRSPLSTIKKCMGVMHVGLGVMLAYVIFYVFGLYHIENSICPIPT